MAEFEVLHDDLIDCSPKWWIDKPDAVAQVAAHLVLSSHMTAQASNLAAFYRKNLNFSLTFTLSEFVNDCTHTRSS